MIEGSWIASLQYPPNRAAPYAAPADGKEPVYLAQVWSVGGG